MTTKTNESALRMCNVELVMKQIIFIILSFFLFSITSCDEPKEYDDVEAYIISFKKWGDRKVSIKYQVENTGNKSIEGWKIWFNVNFERGPKIECIHGTTYQLNPGDISSPKIKDVDVPVLNDNAINVTLKRIVVY